MVPVREQGRFYQYRIVILVLLLAITVWLNLRFVKPVFMGAIFAIVLSPLMNRFGRWKLSVTARAAIISVVFMVIVLMPFGILVLSGAEATIQKAQSLQSFDVSKLQRNPMVAIDMIGLRPLLDRIIEISPFTESQMLKYLSVVVTSVAQFAGEVMQRTLASIPGLIFSNFIVVLATFFLLIDGPRAVTFLKQNSFFDSKQTERIFLGVSNLSYAVVVATVLSGATQSMLIGLICLITGVGNIALMMLLSFIASFVPVVGTGPISLYLAAEAFYHGNTWVGVVWLVGAGVVSLSDNVVRPYVMKGGARLHPLIAFISAFGGLDTLGFYGLFIGPVVTGLFFVMLPIVTRSFTRSGRRPEATAFFRY